MPRFRWSGLPRLRTKKTREHFRARKAMKNGFILFEVFFWIRAGAKFLASLAQGIEPSGVFSGILLLQFFPQTLRERWTFAVRGDGNLQIAALHDGTIVEMAISNCIKGIAENAVGFGGLKHSDVHRLQRS